MDNETLAELLTDTRKTSFGSSLDHVNLGSLNHGNDKLKISQEFAKFLLDRIIAID
jgi:hypothetical protein